MEMFDNILCSVFTVTYGTVLVKVEKLVNYYKLGIKIME